jgi:hypothetical protein
MWTSRTPFAGLAAAMLAVACGGDGDGGDAGPPAPTSVLISAVNQDTVARASLASMMPLLTVPVAPAAARSSAYAPSAGLAHIALEVARDGIKPPAQPTAGIARPTALYPTVYPCRISGTLTYVWNDSDESATVNPGDSVSMTFSQCIDAPGLVINGKLGMAIAGYWATVSAEDLTGSISYQALTMTDAAGSFLMEGGVTFHINRTESANGDDMLSSFTVASGGLTVDKRSVAGGLSDTFSYRAGYAVTDHDFSSRVPGVSSWEVITASGSFRAQSLGGDLHLTTTTPFKSVFSNLAGDIFPSEGQLIAIGQNATRLGLAATGTLQVRMDLCDDGDNTWEASKTVTWDWLLQ